MIRRQDANRTEWKARPATDEPTDIELARRLNILADANLKADCFNSTAPIVKRLLLWCSVAAAAWLVMILLGKL